VLFHREQYQEAGFPFRPFTRDERVRWVCFREALSGAPRWVPEELGYLFQPAGRSHSLCPSVSTGLSCGRAGQPILLRGLQEVIERDAVVGAWWGRYRIAERRPAEVLGLLGPQVASRLLRPNLRYRFFRIDSPYSSQVTLVTVEGEEREGFCFAVGSACRETGGESWKKSILEAVHGYSYVRHLRETREESLPEGPPATFGDHAIYYALHPERLEATALRRSAPTGRSETAGGEAEPGPPGREDLAILAGRLGKEHPILFRNMTPPGIASEIGGWNVLRVLVPELQPLHGSHRLAHLGGPLWAPRGLGDYSKIPPHPFA
jgi:ribosomal protein S12 methylthiotransferase accessory factor